MFRREDGVAAYHLALERRTDHEVSSRRLRRRTGPEVDFFDYEVPEGPLAGRAIKQISWPPGCTVVSVHRGRSVLVPDGSTVLEVGDRLTVYGNESGRNRFIERLDRREEGASADRPTEIQ